jgi:UDP-N-acetyl-D-glucosamine dehydrogenase
VTRNRDPDLSYVRASAASAAASLRPGQLVVLESTTWPGTTDEVVRPLLEAGGLQVGREVFLAFSPEREDPGNPNFSASVIPKLVGGTDEASGKLAYALYSRVVSKAHFVSSAEVAETAKLLENIFRAVNIALVNEMKTVLTDMNIDVWEVVAAASTKPFGFMPFYPGPGLGGHCIPIDPFYLTWKAKEVGRTTRFIELAGEVNTAMPHYVVDRTQAALNDDTKSMKGSKILVIGVAYKADVNDMRESPALKVISLLKERGADVSYHDPHVPELEAGHGLAEPMTGVPLNDATLAAADCVAVVTAHSGIDWVDVAAKTDLVVDFRNAVPREENVWPL